MWVRLQLVKICQKDFLIFVDIDKLIEDKEGCSINIIFKNKSEIILEELKNL